MQAAFRTLLTGDAPFAALVSTRIYWNALPQAVTRPAVVMFLVTGAEGLAHDGPDGLASYIVQVDVQALTVTSMWAIRDAIVAKLHGYKDSTFRLIRHDSERQSAEELAGAGSLIHRASLDFTVWATA